MSSNQKSGIAKASKAKKIPSTSFNFLARASARTAKKLKRKYILSPQPIPTNMRVIQAAILNKDQPQIKSE